MNDEGTAVTTTVGRSLASCGTTVVVPPSVPGTVRVVIGTLVTMIVFVPSVPETVVVPPRLPASKLVKLEGTDVTITVGRSVASCGTTVVVPPNGPGTVLVVTGTFVTMIVFVPSVPDTVVVPPRLPA